jgi:hypothetical protein
VKKVDAQKIRRIGIRDVLGREKSTLGWQKKRERSTLESQNDKSFGKT